MDIPPQRRTAKLTRDLRIRAGHWLRELREKRGLSQRQLAEKVGTEHYTFISQLEHGRGRIPPDCYLVWAHALGVDPRELVQGLMPYYDPVTYSIIFEREPRTKGPATRAGPRVPSAKIKRMKRRPFTG
jgi:transcriptional regulator with XRE-family HTH domain